MFSPKSPIRKLFDMNFFHKKRIYMLNEGSIEDYEMLGTKGANLCEMSRLGIPTAPGFIVTAETCAEYFDRKDDQAAIDQLMQEYLKGIKELEKLTGKVFGNLNIGHEHLPLLLSVRSAAAVVLPGLTDTVLNVGINDEIALIMARNAKNPRWAYDTYRRFIQMYGTVVLHIDKECYEDVLRQATAKYGIARKSMLTAEDLQHVVEQFKQFTPFPQDPTLQLQQVVTSMFTSWYSARAVKYRAVNNIKTDCGCALVIQSMVYGNLNLKSGSGILFTRSPISGSSFISGEFLMNADGEDVTNGERHTMAVTDLRTDMPDVYTNLIRYGTKLEKHYRDMQDIEFTVENGVLYVLESKRGKRTASAAVQIAVSMVIENVIHEREALLRINPKQMDYYIQPVIDEEQMNGRGAAIACQLIPASTCCATGKIVLTSMLAEECSRGGEPCILWMEDYRTEDLFGVKAAKGAVVLHSGPNSYAAEVMRNKNKPAVVGGTTDLHIDWEQGAICNRNGDVILREGDVVTVDGGTGKVYRGEVPTRECGSGEFFHIVMGWADKYKRLHVHADVSSVEEAKRAVELGTEGIGMFRSENMFLEEGCLDLFRQAMLASTAQDRCTFLGKLLIAHQLQYEALFRLMDHKPVTVRLLDHSLEEWFPSLLDLDTDEYYATVSDIADRLGYSVQDVLHKIESFQCGDTTMGRRSCRSSVLYPEIVVMQTKAIAGAALQVREEGIEVFPCVLLPLVGNRFEAEFITPLVYNTWAQVCEDMGHSVNYLVWSIGVALQEPRACLVADRIMQTEHLDFVNVCADDLSELVFGASREDTQKVMHRYVDKHVVAKSPFESLDIQAVGSMLHLAVNKSKQASDHTIPVIVSGAHSGDPFSIRFLNRIGVDIVTCIPNRIAVAKIAAAQAQIEQSSIYEGETAMNENIYRRLLTGEIIL